ncbi:MAG: NDP-sugar synthase [Armatimonadetes bacterium]|nr:NDP-sugar synthase [Armatimonadota bacterium]
MKAMILAAGEGTRLRPLTLNLPKPMVPVANVPLLVRTIALLRAHGITEIAVNLHYRGEIIQDTLGDGSAHGVRLHYSDEPELMGTAGGVKRMEAFLDEPFLVLYGDNLYRADFAPLLAAHQKSGAVATIATFTTPDPTSCGLVVIDAAGIVTRFQEKPPAHEVFTDQANAGVYVCDPAIFSYIPEGTVYDFGKNVFPAILEAGRHRIAALTLSGYLQDTGTVENYRKANFDALTGATGDPAIAVCGVTMGEDTMLASSALLDGLNILGGDCFVAEHAHLTDCILWDGCHIGSNATLTNAILGRNVLVGAYAIIGDGAILADNVRVAPGTTVPASERVTFLSLER